MADRPDSTRAQKLKKFWSAQATGGYPDNNIRMATSRLHHPGISGSKGQSLGIYPDAVDQNAAVANEEIIGGKRIDKKD